MFVFQLNKSALQERPVTRHPKRHSPQLKQAKQACLNKRVGEEGCEKTKIRKTRERSHLTLKASTLVQNHCASKPARVRTHATVHARKVVKHAVQVWQIFLVPSQNWARNGSGEAQCFKVQSFSYNSSPLFFLEKQR